MSIGPQSFRRGDADSSGMVNVGDAVHVLSRLFLIGGLPPCPDAADADAQPDSLPGCVDPTCP